MGFVVMTLIFVIIGSQGPQVFDTITWGNSTATDNIIVVNGPHSSGQNSTTWVGNIDGVTHDQQLMWMTVKYSRPLNLPLSQSYGFEQHVGVKVLGSMTSFNDLAARVPPAKVAADVVLADNKDVVRKPSFPSDGRKFSDFDTLYNLLVLKYPYYQVQITFKDVPTNPYSYNGE